MPSAVTSNHQGARKNSDQCEAASERYQRILDLWLGYWNDPCLTGQALR